MSILNSTCALHYEFNLNFFIQTFPFPSPLGEAEPLDCCCGKLDPNKDDVLVLLVFAKIQLQHFRRTHLGINSTRDVSRNIIFSTSRYLHECAAYKEEQQLDCFTHQCACHSYFRWGWIISVHLEMIMQCLKWLYRVNFEIKCLS